ncbi:multiheme c-type cytochrome [Adhaeretor mobilis]|uniref:Cytochrome c-552/4 domain-containing protein n=1 Tax=Adhaeretor mobilis TaxID=1930276 RepID=A0A517N0G7_9BACT|nr:multiheme c-type cytochrome [Adhaeretor mobilis]QDT00627.1 hypothetical protein HG15A2_39660 [Adhaeretor mobilis]
MKSRHSHPTIESLLPRAALLVVTCGLLGYWFSGNEWVKPGESDPLVRDTISVATSATQEHPECNANEPSALNLQVQEMLAQGGCPGWISLASEPQLLQELPPLDAQQPSPHTQHDGQVRATAYTDQEPTDDDLLGEQDDLLELSPLPSTHKRPSSNETPPKLSTEAEQNKEQAEDLLEDRNDLLEVPREGLSMPKNGITEESEEDLLNDRDDLLMPDLQDTTDRAFPNDQSATNNNRTPSGVIAPSGGRAPNSSPRENSHSTGQATQPQQGGLFAPPALDAPNPHAGASTGKTDSGKKTSTKTQQQLQQERCQFVADSMYPDATSCRTCHEKIYDEWSVSSHAYAAVSPMYQKFEQTIHNLTHGTIGYFCFRCHSPVGTALGYQRTTALWDMPQAAREGVTCVACHRVNEMYSKTNGERRIVPGDIHAPVYGTIGGDGVAEVIAKRGDYKVKIDPNDKKPGQPIHQAGLCFPQLSKSEFCTSCHQVAVHPGIKLEVVWEQYRASPACKKGVSCQDCHMGRIPGVASGYEVGAAAIVNKKKVNENRKHANHTFYGPGYSIAHPGVFPWHPKAKRWTMQEWLMFDWRAGWGTKGFEDAVDNGIIEMKFPKVWDDVDDRMDAREIIEDNQKKLAKKNKLRHAVLENGSHVDGPFFKRQPRVGQDLRFTYNVINTNDGHNLPTASLGAQPQLWANVVLIGPTGERLWETGYLDCNGDLADIHSVEVRNKRMPFDWQLFNLQTMFLITGAKGTDREFPLPVNVSIDQLPFIRPGAQPISTINHPPFIRMESRSLPALGSRKVPYKVPGKLVCQPGRYRLSFRMRSRAEPPYFMRFCNSTPEMVRSMTEGIMDFHQASFEFEVR